MCGNVQGGPAGWQTRAGGDACPRSPGAQRRSVLALELRPGLPGTCAGHTDTGSPCTAMPVCVCVTLSGAGSVVGNLLGAREVLSGPRCLELRPSKRDLPFGRE